MNKTQTLAGYIREHLDEIELKLYNGILQESIVEEINKNGYNTTAKAFRTYLHRARNRRKQLDKFIKNENKSNDKSNEFIHTDASKFDKNELI